MISEFIFIASIVLIVMVGAYNSIRHFQRAWVAGGGSPRRGWWRGALSVVVSLGGMIVFIMTLSAVYHAFNWPGAMIVTGASLAVWVIVHSAFFTPPPKGTGDAPSNDDKIPSDTEASGVSANLEQEHDAPPRPNGTAPAPGEDVPPPSLNN